MQQLIHLDIRVRPQFRLPCVRGPPSRNLVVTQRADPLAPHSYVPIKPDMSDLAARVQYVLDPSNDRALQQIAAASTVVARRLDLAYAARKLKSELEVVFNA